MSDIFMSYSSSEKERVRPLVERFEQQGWTVWWDRKIPPGKSFDEVIEEAVNAAKCVVAVWSTESVKSTWVKTEAAEGEKRGILIPVLLDDVEIPFEFRRIQAAKLTDLTSLSTETEFKELMSAISTMIGKPLREEQLKPGMPISREVTKERKRAVRVYGEVSDAKKQIPVAEAKVSLFHGKKELAVLYSDSEGEFDHHIETSQIGDTLVCKVEKKGYEPREMTHMVKHDEIHLAIEIPKTMKKPFPIYAVPIIILIAALILIFIFWRPWPITRTGTLIIRSIPDRAEIYINEELKGITPFKEKLSEGTYSIKLRKPPFHKEEMMKLEIYAGKTFSKTIPLKEFQTGFLEINTRPEGAEVYIDDNLHGTTPFKKELPPGTYTLIISKSPQYQEEIIDLQIRVGQTLSKDVDLKPLYIVGIASVPTGAKFWVDEEYIGTTPRTMKIDKNIFRLKIEKNGYDAHNQRVTLRQGENQPLRIQLKRKAEGLSIDIKIDIKTDPPGAFIYLNDVLIGPTPLEKKISPGEYKLKVEKEGYMTLEKTVKIEADFIKVYPLSKIQLKKVAIRIGASPWAKVFIDGTLIGEVPPEMTLEIEEGIHKFEFVSTGYPTISESVRIKSGEKIRVIGLMHQGKIKIEKM